MSKMVEMEKLGERIAEQAAHIDAAMHRLLYDLRIFDGECGWYMAGAKSCAAWLSWRVGWDLATAREHVRVARKLGELPRIDDALRRGVVSYSKVRAMTRVATPATEETLLEWSGKCTAAHLENICSKYRMVKRISEGPADADETRRYFMRRTLDDGMVMIQVTLRPEEAALIMTAVEKAAKDVSAEALEATDEKGKKKWRPFNRVDGLMAIIEGHARGASPDRAPVEMVVRVTRESLAGQDVSAETSEASPEGFDELAELADGAWISQQAARRLACDAGIVELIESPGGETLSVGRKRRSTPTPMKRALLERDRTCRFPGCDNRLFVQAHHIEHWVNGGETRLDNLISLCSFHHTFLHEAGYTVAWEDGQPVFRTPKGFQVRPQPERCLLSAEEMGWPAIRDANDDHGVAIDERTNFPDWDGLPVNYEYCVDALAVIEGLR
jgi:hypothetical protein